MRNNSCMVESLVTGAFDCNILTYPFDSGLMTQLLWSVLLVAVFQALHHQQVSSHHFLVRFLFRFFGFKFVIWRLIIVLVFAKKQMECFLYNFVIMIGYMVYPVQAMIRA